MTVEDFASGAEFLVSRWPSDAGCLILDIDMPRMSGIDVLSQMRSGQNSLPVIVVTGQLNAIGRQKALAVGVLAILEKPVNDGALVELVRKTLRERSDPYRG